MAQISLRIEGMTCGHCERAVRTTLLAQAGVHDVTVDRAAGSAVVEIDPSQFNQAAAIDALVEEGYPTSVG